MSDQIQAFTDLEVWIQAGILGLAAVILFLVVLLMAELTRAAARRTHARASDRQRSGNGHQDDDEITEIYTGEESARLHRELDLLNRDEDDKNDEAPLFCQDCGASNVADSTFCEACGVAMDMTRVRHQLGWREGPVILSVGRHVGSTIVLHGDPMISSGHAQFRFWKGTLTVHDLGSSNGTFINSNRISDATMVVRGDRLRFGQTTMSFDQVITFLSQEIGQRKGTIREGRSR